ncbi:hypothetical protein KOR34_11700 [Posidoniimonas corsicana]|uniref:DUF2007 domain-containing protein n=1 Tax=Posidoniimonas corsicana TaxID=1938618 RepID=A0A5C5VCB0_9BACT|nr:DUF2007 domain-containing protein [Posidoniimonas corsicana]TWT36266.1 hypothetical protein KOR34_11700 [Posidoniimonas corsicana]
MKPDPVNPFESPQTESRPDGEAELAGAASETDGLPIPRGVHGDGIVTVASFGYINEASVAVSLLQQEGINCCLDNEGIVSVNAFLSNAVGGVKVLVHEKDAERAACFLHEHRRSLQAKQSQEDIEFDCEECGAPLKMPGNRRGRVETCPKCREFIDVPE